MWKFLGGFVLGTAGLKVLTSNEAKDVYAHVTAYGLRAKDECLKQADIIRENAGDIYARAKEINNEDAKLNEQDIIEDLSGIDA